MEMSNIVDFSSRDEISDALTDLLRTGAQQLIASAVEAELEGFLRQFSHTRTTAGHAEVVRNGHHPARPIQTGIGPVSVRIPKVRSKEGKPVTFRSALVPPYALSGSAYAVCMRGYARREHWKQPCPGFTSKVFPLVRWERL